MCAISGKVMLLWEWMVLMPMMFVFVSGKFGMHKYLYGLLDKLTRSFCIIPVFYGRRILGLWAMQTTVIAQVMVLIHCSECAKRVCVVVHTVCVCMWVEVGVCGLV